MKEETNSLQEIENQDFDSVSMEHSTTNEEEYKSAMKKIALLALILLISDVFNVLTKPIKLSTIILFIVEWGLLIAGTIYTYRYYKGKK